MILAKYKIIKLHETCFNRTELRAFNTDG